MLLLLLLLLQLRVFDPISEESGDEDGIIIGIAGEMEEEDDEEEDEDEEDITDENPCLLAVLFPGN